MAASVSRKYLQYSSIYKGSEGLILASEFSFQQQLQQSVLSRMTRPFSYVATACPWVAVFSMLGE